jgi:lysozyme
MEKVIKLLLILLIFLSPVLSSNDHSQILILNYNYQSNHTTRSLIEKFEGIKLTAYRCPSGVATIGIGSTYYENGKSVKMGDVITIARVHQLYDFNINQIEKQLKNLVKVELTKNQKSALTSFLYNVGYGNFEKSKLLDMINKNPNDFRIQHEFMKWTTSKGRPMKGLRKRRIEELELYFTKNKS